MDHLFSIPFQTVHALFTALGYSISAAARNPFIDFSLTKNKDAVWIHTASLFCFFRCQAALPCRGGSQIKLVGFFGSLKPSPYTSPVSVIMTNEAGSAAWAHERT